MSLSYGAAPAAARASGLLTGTGVHQYNLVVKNFGATAATDVRVKITPDPRSANLRNSKVEDSLSAFLPIRHSRQHQRTVLL
jgi:hypothetical protein